MSLLSRLLNRDVPNDAPSAVRMEPPVVAAQSSGTSAPNPEIFNIGFGGTGSRVKSLPPVTPVIAQRHATVFACCNIIAGDMSKVPLKVMQRTKNGQEVQVREHPAGYLLNVEAAPMVPAKLARFALIYAYALRGRSYAYAPRDGAGELTLIDVLHPDLCTMLRDGRARFYEFEDGAGVRRRSPARAMLHLRYMAEDGWTGRSPIEVAAESMGLALAGQEAAARAASGSVLRAYAKLSDSYEDEEARMRSAQRLSRALREPEVSGIPFINPDEEIQRLDLSAADQQLLESRKFDREQIAGIYRMPPSKLQMLEHGVKANGQQQAIDYKTDCLLHWSVLAEDSLQLGILTEAERRQGLFLRHDFDALMQATTKERYDALSKAVGGPFMLWQEARRIEGLADLEEGQQPYPPSNMTRDEGKSKGDKDED